MLCRILSIIKKKKINKKIRRHFRENWHKNFCLANKGLGLRMGEGGGGGGESVKKGKFGTKNENISQIMLFVITCRLPAPTKVFLKLENNTKLLLHL